MLIPEILNRNVRCNPEKEALVYFDRDDFPERYVRNLYKELEKKISAKRAIEKKDSDEFL